MIRSCRLFLTFSLSLTVLLSACSGKSRLKMGVTSSGEVVEAEGLTPYDPKDLPGTQKRGLVEAQKAAVEKVVGVYITAKTRVEKAALIESQILANVAGYVKKYDLISQRREGEWYRVKIRALVGIDQINQELSEMGLIRGPALGNPRIAVHVVERFPRQQYTTRYTETALSKVLLERGFLVQELSPAFRWENDPALVAQSLKNERVDVFILATANASPVEIQNNALGGLSSYRALVNGQVFKAGSGEVIMVLAGEASGLAGTPEAAAAKAFSEAVKSGVANDLNRLASELQKRNGLEVQVQNVALAQLEQVKVALESMAGVQEVYLRSYEDHVAQLQVMTNQLASQDVAKQLSQSEKLNLDVVKINAQMIILKSSFTQ